MLYDTTGMTRSQIEEMLITVDDFEFDDPRDHETDEDDEDETTTTDEEYFAGYDPTDPLWITDAELEARIDRDAELRQMVRDISDSRWKREQELQIAELEAQLKDATNIFPLLDRIDSIRKHGPEVEGDCGPEWDCGLEWDLNAFGKYGTLCKDLHYVTTELLHAKRDLNACLATLAQATGYADTEALLRGRKLGDLHFQVRDSLSCIENGIGRIQRVARKLDDETLPTGNSFFGLERDAAVDIRNSFFIPTRRGIYRAIWLLGLADPDVESRCMEATADLRNVSERLADAGRVLSDIEDLMKGEIKVMKHHGWLELQAA